MSILVEAAVPHFGEPELPLDNTKLVFHLCPDAGLVPVPGVISRRRQRENVPKAISTC